MSINPVQGSGPATGPQFADAALAPGPTTSVRSCGGNSLPGPIREQPQNRKFSAPRILPKPIEMPQDEVEVQRDGGDNAKSSSGTWTGSGNVILQVPSSEVLGMARAIDQDFQQEAKARANARRE